MISQSLKVSPIKNFYYSVLKYAVFGSGPLTVLGGVEVGHQSILIQNICSVYEE